MAYTHVWQLNLWNFMLLIPSRTITTRFLLRYQTSIQRAVDLHESNDVQQQVLLHAYFHPETHSNSLGFQTGAATRGGETTYLEPWFGSRSLNGDRQSSVATLAASHHVTFSPRKRYISQFSTRLNCREAYMHLVDKKSISLTGSERRTFRELYIFAAHCSFVLPIGVNFWPCTAQGEAIRRWQMMSNK